jgi:hypothetical protein
MLAPVVIDDTELRSVLGEMGVVKTSIRGSSYRGKNFEGFFVFMTNLPDGESEFSVEEWCK